MTFLGSLLNDITGLALQYGYPGVLTVATLGSAVPFLPLPYLALVVILSNTLDPFWLGVVAGVGGAAGKVTSYLLGRGGYKLANEETRRNLDALQGFASKYGALGVFVFALTPLPDDVYVIPMGMMKLPFWRFFIAILAGKMTLSVSVAFLGKTYFSLVSPLLGEESLPFLVGAIAVTVVLSMILMRADWMLAVKLTQAEGLSGLIRGLPSVLRLKRGGRREK